jgi:hypothetical protein
MRDTGDENVGGEFALSQMAYHVVGPADTSLEAGDAQSAEPLVDEELRIYPKLEGQLITSHRCQ